MHQPRDQVAPPVDTNTHETGQRRHHSHRKLKSIPVIGNLKTKVRRIHSERPSTVVTRGEPPINGHKPDHAASNGKVPLQASQSVSDTSSPRNSEKSGHENRTFLTSGMARVRWVASSL